MEGKPLKTAVTMAIIMGVFLPLAETVRRANQIFDLTKFFSWFDDYILGSILLIAAHLVRKKKHNSISFLIAAWGIAAGALFLSFLGQLEYYITSAGDPGIFSTNFVTIAKVIILGYMLVGLHLSIKSNAP
ncbi:hypothetical protein L0337_07060 [candidate division KSB1 bacterium]|nr:hypothetical protein [candidate division KSB1 bacterium]